MDGKSSDGGATETSQPKGLFCESKTSPTGQETRSRSKTPTRFQKVWQDKMFVLHLCQQHQDPHQHPDWTNVADKAIHHLRGRQCCVQRHLLTWCWTVPKETSPIYWEGRTNKAMQGLLHRAQGGCKSPLGHGGGRTLQLAWP